MTLVFPFILLKTIYSNMLKYPATQYICTFPLWSDRVCTLIFCTLDYFLEIVAMVVQMYEQLRQYQIKKPHQFHGTKTIKRNVGSPWLNYGKVYPSLFISSIKTPGHYTPIKYQTKILMYI